MWTTVWNASIKFHSSLVKEVKGINISLFDPDSYLLTKYFLMLSYFAIITNLECKYSHFTDETTEVQGR